MALVGIPAEGGPGPGGSDQGRARLELFASTGAEAFGVRLLEGQARVVGSAPEADLVLAVPGVAPRHLRLRAAEGLLEVEPLAPGATLNDVLVSGAVRARPGDALRLGEATLLVLQRTDAPPPVERLPLPSDAFAPLLVGELSRALAHGVPLGLCLMVGRRALGPVDTPRDALTCTLGSCARAFLWLGASEQDLRGFGAAVRASQEAVRTGVAHAPNDGVRWEQLVAVAFEHLEGAEDRGELVVVDPAMVRLLETLEGLSRTRGPLLLRGEAGTGRAVLARAIHARGPRQGQAFEVAHTLEREGALLLGREATVFIPEVEGLSAASRLALVQALRRGNHLASVVLGADKAVPLAPELEALVARRTVEIPALRDRPRDLLPLAQAMLGRVAAATGRPVPTLTPAAVRVLEAHRWPGNVRELEAAVVLAALATPGDQLRVEHLPAPVRMAADAASLPVTDLRRELDDAERQALLNALAATGWNVTEAAKRLGLPRRTVVYRMARLRLKRPRPAR